MVFSTLAYALTWVPGIGVFGILGLMVVISFFIIAYPSWKQWSTIMIAYGMHWVLVVLVLVSTFMAVHGVSALQEIPAVMRYSSSTSSKSILNIQGSGPIARNLQWYSTGSEWLDEKFVGVEIHIKVTDADPEVLSDQGYEFEFKGDNGTLLFYQTIHSADMMVYTDLTDFDVVYTILLTAESDMEFGVEIIGLMPVKSLDIAAK